MRLEALLTALAIVEVGLKEPALKSQPSESHVERQCVCDCAKSDEPLVSIVLIGSLLAYPVGGPLPQAHHRIMASQDASPEELQSCLPGDRLIDFYEDDDRWHERILIWWGRGTRVGCAHSRLRSL